VDIKWTDHKTKEGEKRRGGFKGLGENWVSGQTRNGIEQRKALQKGREKSEGGSGGSHRTLENS